MKPSITVKDAELIPSWTGQPFLTAIVVETGERLVSSQVIVVSGNTVETNEANYLVDNWV